MRVLITAGPTREYLDPVRYLSNGSSGKMGYALAAAALDRGFEVDLVSGPVALHPPPGAALHRVVSAEDMLAACMPLFGACDVFIAVAAVADYRPKERSSAKRKKTGGEVTLTLVPTVDVLRTLAATKTARQIIIGFAAETHDVEAYAQKKLVEKNCDWVVANDVAQAGIGMDAENNAVLLIGRAGERVEYGPDTKKRVAEFILDQVLATVVRPLT